ncbi:very-long-chain acyl-CoA dehydrogenase [Trichoderma sp. SZMC 28014]
MESSGADKGFFQQPPALPNQFYDDVTFQRCFKLFLPADLRDEIEPEVARLGQEVLTDRIFAWISDAERNKPYLKGSGRSAFGKWKGELVTTEGWRRLQEFGFAKGFVADGYDAPYGRFSRNRQFLRLLLWEGSSANVTCPTAMQDGAARMLQLHLTTPSLSSKLSETEKRVYENAFQHLISRDPKRTWTSGQWMTERRGGSDVSLSETTAVYRPNESNALASKEDDIPLGPWSINGFKWFSSATDCNMTILLARTPAGKLSTFIAPLRKHDPSALNEAGNPDPNGQCLNGVRIQRLKNKHGTQSVPTAELVLEDMRGWLIGDENRGIQEISVLLHLTRIHTTSQAVGYAGRGLAVARAFARVREVGAGRGARMRLTDSTLHMKTLARMTAEYRRLMLFHMFTVYILGLSEHPTEKDADKGSASALQALTPTLKDVEPLLRVLTSVTKAYVSNSALTLLFSCMESIGGVGYLLNEESEYLNIARLYRDCGVLPIWEGTTDVLSTDFIRALKRPETGVQSIDALDNIIKQAFAFRGDAASYRNVVQRWDKVKTRITKESQADLVGKARDLMWSVAEVLMAALLHVDANNSGGAAEREILQRYLEDKFSASERVSATTREELERDFSIVYGEEHVKTASNL